MIVVGCTMVEKALYVKTEAAKRGGGIDRHLKKSFTGRVISFFLKKKWSSNYIVVHNNTIKFFMASIIQNHPALCSLLPSSDIEKRSIFMIIHHIDPVLNLEREKKRYLKRIQLWFPYPIGEYVEHTYAVWGKKIKRIYIIAGPLRRKGNVSWLRQMATQFFYY